MAGRPNHVRLASLASQNLDPKEKDRLAHLKELRHGKNDETVHGVEEAEVLLATHALPVPLGTSEKWRSRKRLCLKWFTGALSDPRRCKAGCMMLRLGLVGQQGKKVCLLLDHGSELCLAAWS